MKSRNPERGGVRPLPSSAVRGALAPNWWTKLRANSSPFLFMSPATIAVILFFFLPVILTVYFSLTDMSVATGLRRYHFVGLENYSKMLGWRWTAKLLKNTFLYVACTLIFFNVGLGLFLSLLTTHIQERVGTLFRTLWLLPRVTPSVIYALLWKWVTASPPYGILNQFITPLGIEGKNWMFALPWAWVVVIMVNGFVGASFGMIIFTSAIKSIPEDYIMAAKVDGASTLQIIRRIILPLIRWPILFVTAYQTLSLLTSFEYILLTTEGGPGFYGTEVWSLHAYYRALSNYYGNQLYGYGAALAAVLVVIGIIASIFYLRVFRFRGMIAEPKIEVL